MKRFRLCKHRQRCSSSLDSRDVTIRTPISDNCCAPRKRYALQGCQRASSSSLASHDNMVCMICQEDNTENDDSHTTLPCGHTCHSNCISKWIERSNSCPMCRCEIATEVELPNDQLLLLSEEENLEIMAFTLGVQSTVNRAENIEDLLASCISQRHMSHDLR
jgi:hypothetical protein